MRIIFFLIAVSAVSAVTLHTISNSDSDETLAIKYLKQYGYLRNDITSNLLSSNKTLLTSAIELFQEFYNIAGNGVLNADTIDLMKRPRCGVRDFSAEPFSQSSGKWPKKELSWNFYLATTELTSLAQYAFHHWAAISPLTFYRNKTNPDILISMQIGRHTFANTRISSICSLPFDGRGNVLAHAFFPTGDANFTSEIHIDKSEAWHIYLNKNSDDTTHLLHTLVHEIGHALGLSHSTNNNSVMYPYSPSNQFPVQMSIEDRIAIQNLYGVKNDVYETTSAPLPQTTVSATTTTAKSDKPQIAPDLCQLKRVDAILFLPKRMYIARGRYLWSVDTETFAYGDPLMLTDYMKFLPANFTRVSAVYQRPSGEIVLFASKRIYVIDYPSIVLRSEWPKKFEDIGLPAAAKINAAINTHTGRTFILYDDQRILEINECDMTPRNYYTQQTIFPGIPSTIRLAFRHIDGNIYFASKTEYFQFNEFEVAVKSAGKLDLSIVNISCPRNSLLQSLQSLLSRLVGQSKDRYNADEEEEGII